MTHVKQINVVSLANVCGGRRRDVVTQKPVPAEWLTQPPPAGYSTGIPDFCRYEIRTGRRSVEKGVIPPTNCWAQPDSFVPDGNQ